MKKRFLALSLAGILSVTTLAGCDIIESLTKEQITEAMAEPICTVLNVNELPESDLSDMTVNKSWKDQMGNRYYILYLGKIELAEIYTYDSIRYAGEVDKLEIEEETVSVDKIIETYQSTVTTTISWYQTDYVEETFKLSAGASKGILSAEVEKTFKESHEKKYGRSYTVEDKNVLTTITEKTKSIATKKVVNYARACTPGKYYRYSVCGDVNCYMNLYVPADGSEAQYDVCSQLVDPEQTYDILLESDTHNGFQSREKFSLDGFDASTLEEPTEVIPCYPEVEVSSVDYSECDYWKGVFEVPATSYHNFSISIVNFDNYFNWGYNKIEVKYSFSVAPQSYNLFGVPDMHCYICNAENKDSRIYSFDEKMSESGKVYSGKLVVDLETFKLSKRIYLYCENKHVGSSYSVSNIVLSYKIYHVA